MTYAAYWIRAYISQYLIRSRSLVTAGVRSKLLSKVRRERAKAALSCGEETNADSQLAFQLALTPEKLRSLVERLDLRDVSWDINSEDALSTHFLEPHHCPLNARRPLCARRLMNIIRWALSKLDERETTHRTATAHGASRGTVLAGGSRSTLSYLTGTRPTARGARATQAESRAHAFARVAAEWIR